LKKNRNSISKDDKIYFTILCSSEIHTWGEQLATEKKLTAGDEIDSRCLKCKDVTNHIIVAMVKTEVAKVECNVCGARHKYRAPKAEKTPKKKSTKKAKSTRTSKEAKNAALFFELTEGLDQNNAITYAMTQTFQEGDLLKHSVFGLGFVTNTIKPNKIEVIFEQYSKVLISELK